MQGTMEKKEGWQSASRRNYPFLCCGRLIHRLGVAKCLLPAACQNSIKTVAVRLSVSSLTPSHYHTRPSRASGVQLSCALHCGFFHLVGAPFRPQSASLLLHLLPSLPAFHLHLQRGDASLDDIDGCDSTPRGSQHVCHVAPVLVPSPLLTPLIHNWIANALC